ncbi:MAG: hypothetical protein AAGA80_21505 [Cyanobacteria bacterium P01_F01_bin.143]
MEELENLLNDKSSELAKVLRCSLHGMKASLQQAQREYSLGAETSTCQRLIEELDRLLNSHDKLNNDQESTIAISEEKQVDEFKLKVLQAEFFADTRLFPYFGDRIESRSHTDKQLWDEIHYLLLRVPENLAKSWRKRALEIADDCKIKVTTDKKNFVELPLCGNDDNELIHAALKTKEVARGLYHSTKSKFDSRIPQLEKNEELYLHGCLVSTYLKLIELEPSGELHHAFEPVYRFGLKSLADELDRDKYTNALIKCLSSCKKAEQKDILEYLQTRLDLDEAIHSLVFPTPAPSNSWWGQLQQKSRRDLNSVADRARKEGHQVAIRSLTGVYADVHHLSKHNRELDSGGTPGEVLTCLRVYARINGEEHLGRVLYRSLN